MDRALVDPRPDVVFLDVGETLVRPEPSWEDVYASVFAEFRVDVDREAFRTAFREAFAEQRFEGPFEASEEASYERIKELDGRIFARLGYPHLPDEFFRAVDGAFRRRSAWFVFDDVIPALDALRAAGIRLGVISNWTWAAPELLHDLELAAHFEALVISARVGFNKPAAGIFRHALEIMAVPAESALHVGDSYDADVIGARRAGMTAVLIDRSATDPARVRADHDDPDLPVITELYGLLDLLGVARPAAAVR